MKFTRRRFRSLLSLCVLIPVSVFAQSGVDRLLDPDSVPQYNLAELLGTADELTLDSLVGCRFFFVPDPDVKYVAGFFNTDASRPEKYLAVRQPVMPRSALRYVFKADSEIPHRTPAKELFGRTFTLRGWQAFKKGRLFLLERDDGAQMYLPLQVVPIISNGDCPVIDFADLDTERLPVVGKTYYCMNGSYGPLDKALLKVGDVDELFYRLTVTGFRYGAVVNGFGPQLVICTAMDSGREVDIPYRMGLNGHDVALADLFTEKDYRAELVRLADMREPLLQAERVRKEAWEKERAEKAARAAQERREREARKQQETREREAREQQEIREQEAREQQEARDREKKLVRQYGSYFGKLIARERVALGMTRKMCIEAWGEPEDVNRTILPGFVEEQWVYSIDCYLYFTNGKLTAIQD